MMRMTMGLAAISSLLFSIGCAGNSSVSNGIVRSLRVYGQLGITGDENDFTIQAGSELERLSIIGKANKVTVEQGARVSKIEIFGSDNIIHLPRWLIVRKSIVGSNNQFLETASQQITIPQPNYTYQSSPYGAPPPQSPTYYGGEASTGGNTPTYYYNAGAGSPPPPQTSAPPPSGANNPPPAEPYRYQPSGSVQDMQPVQGRP